MRETRPCSPGVSSKRRKQTCVEAFGLKSETMVVLASEFRCIEGPSNTNCAIGGKKRKRRISVWMTTIPAARPNGCHMHLLTVKQKMGAFNTHIDLCYNPTALWSEFLKM